MFTATKFAAYIAAFALTIAGVVSVTWLADVVDSSPATVVHALAVSPQKLTGPCDGMPELDATTLAWLFAPALAKGEPNPVAVVDAKTFTIQAPGGGVYTTELGDDGVPAVSGPDGASAALLRRDVAACLGFETLTAKDAPGMWNASGQYVPLDGVAVVPAADQASK